MTLMKAVALVAALLLVVTQQHIASGFALAPGLGLSSKTIFRLAAAMDDNSPGSNRTPEIVIEIDPKDPKYQVSEEFQPDKESTWPFPIQADGWVLAHDTIRYQMKQIQQALEALVEREEAKRLDNDKYDGVLEDWVVQYLQETWDVHHELVHLHHTDEDEIMVPEFQKRFVYSDKLEADHQEIEDILKKLNHMFHNDLKQPFDGKLNFIIQFFEGGTLPSPADKLKTLLQEFNHYQDYLKPHLLEEEQTMLPLERAYFTPQDLVPMNGQIVASAPAFILGAVIHCTNGKAGFQAVMEQDGMPAEAFEAAWDAAFAPGYQDYLNLFANKLQALKEGKEMGVKVEQEEVESGGV